MLTRLAVLSFALVLSGCAASSQSSTEARLGISKNELAYFRGKIASECQKHAQPGTKEHQGCREFLAKRYAAYITSQDAPRERKGEKFALAMQQWMQNMSQMYGQRAAAARASTPRTINCTTRSPAPGVLGSTQTQCRQY